eukprot:Gb_34663 [translate_table: standard]
MAFGKHVRTDKRSSSWCSTATVVVFVSFCLVGVWMMTSSSVIPAQRVSLPLTNTKSEVKEIVPEVKERVPEVKERVNDSQAFEDSPGDLPDDAIKGDDSAPVQEAEKTSNIDQKTQLFSDSNDGSEKASGEHSDDGKNSEGRDDNGTESEKLTIDENKEANEKISEKVDDKAESWEKKEIDDGGSEKDEGNDGGNENDKVKEEKEKDVGQTENDEKQQSEKEEKIKESKLPESLPNGELSELLKENKVEPGDWETQVTESKEEKDRLENEAVSNSKNENESSNSQKQSTNEQSEDREASKPVEDGEKESKEPKKPQKEQTSEDIGYQYNWKLCNVTTGPDYIPCLDNEKAIKKLHSTAHYEHRERHCPEEPPTCLVPLPEGYKKPINWPKSRDKVWYSNVPHTKLAVIKKHQNWLRVSGEYLTFPGGGTQFKNGALHYIDFIEETIPDIAWGKHSRVVLDVGCGVASFGGFLFERDVLTMSFAPKDEHEAQVQLALERGIPAISAVMGTQRLPFPSVVFDVVHCARCRVPWHVDGGRLLLELNRVLRPGGYFVWSATPVYQKLEEDVAIWKAMSALTASMCWNLLAKKKDRVNGVGVAIYQKPTANTCYELRRKQEPPICEEVDDPNAAWYVPMKSCLHKVPTGDGERGTEWPEEWPLRLEKAPSWLNSGQAGLYGKEAAKDFTSDTEHWKRVVTKSYLTGLGINWSTVRNVMDMKAVYGGFAAALAAQQVWVMNVVPIDSPDTLPIIYDRGLFGIHHDWCQSFNTYPRTYDLLHADHLFSKVKKRCQLVPVMAEVDRILRPGGSVIFRDKSETLDELEPMIKSLHWEIRLTYSKEQEGILCAQKTMWRPAASS